MFAVPPERKNIFTINGYIDKGHTPDDAKDDDYRAIHMPSNMPSVQSLAAYILLAHGLRSGIYDSINLRVECIGQL